MLGLFEEFSRLKRMKKKRLIVGASVGVTFLLNRIIRRGFYRPIRDFIAVVSFSPHPLIGTTGLVTTSGGAINVSTDVYLINDRPAT